jgi:heme o synthase
MVTVRINPLSGLLSFLTLALYVGIYTPLKKITWYNTLIGSIPGALPPLGGWLASSGEFGVGGICLFLILFFWQHPHFYAIAWMYNDDYKQGGFVMLPGIDPTGNRTMMQIFAYLTCLLPISLIPVICAETGILYTIGAFLLFVFFLVAAIELLKTRSRGSAVKLLRASVIYLPVLLTLMVLQVKF